MNWAPLIRRVIASLFLIVSGSVLAGEFTTRQVEPNTIVELRSEEPCLWDARQPLTLDLRQYAILDTDSPEQDIDYIAIFWSGPTKRTIVVDAWRNGPVIPDKDRFVIEVGGGNPNPDDPDPPDPPDPDPSTKYGVGPAVAKGWANVPKAPLAAIFQDVAVNTEQTRNVQIAVKQIRDRIAAINTNGQYSAGYDIYTQEMLKAWNTSKVRTVSDHIGAHKEIATWLLK